MVKRAAAMADLELGTIRTGAATAIVAARDEILVAGRCFVDWQRFTWSFGSMTSIAAFPAVSSLFVLPTDPTLLAAVEMDDTGTIRIAEQV